MTDGQKLVAFYVDECLEQGKPGMVAMKGHVARRAKELYDNLRDRPLNLTAENATMEVQATIREFVRRGCRTPLQLAELFVEMARDRSENATERPAARRRAKDWIKQNGWPTGATFKRGSHSGTYIYDPLGTEPIPMGYEWPYPRPTFDDVVEALA